MKNKNKISKGIIATTLGITVTPSVIISNNNIEAVASNSLSLTDVIDIPDENLANKIRKILSKDDNSEITKNDMLSLPVNLDLSNLKISDLDGLQHATQIESLNLSRNDISDLSYISTLNNLTNLNLGYNNIKDLSDLSTLVSLENLNLEENKIINISHLSSLINLKTLNLEFNNIEDVLDLNSLIELTDLSIRGNSINDISTIDNLTKLNSLDISINEINSISVLSNMQDLEYLNCNMNEIEDITELNTLTNLKFLYLGANNIENLDAISSLNGLLSLDLSSNNFTDKSTLSNISNLSNLKILYLGNNEIEDLTHISTLTGLVVLNLSENNISDLELIKNLITLKDLDLSSNNITDISTISKFENLTKLYLSNNSITNISKLSNLDDLESLSLSNNEISSITTLRNLSNLRYLDLESNNISNISPISNLNNLEVLTLSSNEISDFEPLSQIASLSELNLSELDIDNLDFIDNLVNLNDLNLAFNSIQDISNLSNLINLKSLDLGDNNISDISNLKDLTLLTSLDLKNNSIKNISELSNLTELRYLNLDNNKISDVSSLATLNKLEDLYLNNNMISDISPVAPYRSNFMVWADNQTITINVKRADRVEVKNPIKNDKGNAHNIFGVNAGNGEIVSFDTNNELIIIENVNENSDKVKLSAVQHINNNIIFGTDLIISFSDAQVDLVTNTQDWTNDKVEISYDVISDKVNINKIILPDGSITTNETGVFEVESNGTYNFQAELQDGLILSQDITISNIDKTTPEFEFLLLDTTKLAKNNSVIFTIVATDNESGVEKIILPDNREIFVKPGENSITHEYTIDSAGNYTFIAYDRAGNMIEDTLEILSVHPNPDYPTINASDRTIQQGEIFNALDGVTAFDAQGTPITTINVIADNVKPNEPGRYSVTYEVTDKNGLTAQKTIYVTVVKVNTITSEPTINASDRTIIAGSNYNALDGVTAFDAQGTPITTINVIADNVKPNEPGRYSVTYEVTDSKGISARKTITITVVENTNTIAPPVINTSGRTIEKGSSFDALTGVTALDCNGNDITDDIEVIYDNVNEHMVGRYTVTFRVADSNNIAVEKSITVTVIDSNKNDSMPIIEAYDLTIEKGTKFEPLKGVTATDGKGNDISNKLEVVFSSVNTSNVGTYNVTYQVKHNGVTSQKTITITVVNSYNIIPSITTNDLALIVGEAFNERDGVTATDKEDGDLTSKMIVTENNVDTSRPGTYMVKYSVTDSDGATTTFERTINVYEKEYKPVLKKKSDIILTVNQKYTILDYIEADDKTDSDINTKIRLLNHNVDITRAGVYTAEVQVTNSLGLTTIETFEIVVKDDSSGDNGSSNNNGSSNGSGSNNSGSSTSKPQTGDDLLIYSTGVLLSSSAIISINRKKKEK